MNVVRFPQRLWPVDWQSLSAQIMTPLYAEESDRWSRLLDWDTSARWEEIERRRRQGLPSRLAVIDEAGVVDPQMRKRRLGLQMMELASAAAARAGCRRMTVTVGGSNRMARSLFEASRFRRMGSFLAAGTLQPRRSTSVAPGGAVMTRR